MCIEVSGELFDIQHVLEGEVVDSNYEIVDVGEREKYIQTLKILISFWDMTNNTSRQINCL